jgi:pimeloyl-ACP methyl ester carboxylesterase
MTPPTLQPTSEKDPFTVSRTLENGIERIVYQPRQRRFQTPILMQHGMWHGAWCWQQWQELLAGWGWESHAFSLPGHAGSPVQRPIAECTLEYYLSFLQAEVERLPRRPVLLAHSMGGALAQLSLKYVGDDLPAVGLVAAWVSHDMTRQTLRQILRLDPWGFVLRWREGTATPFIRTPQRAARLFITAKAVYSPEELHARLGPESGLVVMQHRPPLWSPPEQVKTPLLWLAAEKDALIAPSAAQRSAAFYHADYVLVKEAGHDLMLEQNYRQSAQVVHDWLTGRGIE